MLWSPSEVLAYIKDEKSCEDIDKRHADILLPTSPYGGFKTWPNLEEDFILLAENSEIHGPNPLFTIPDMKGRIDLNLTSTQILSADYQGLGNNKILPGKNAQLIMPDIDADCHAAIVYFFLFDSEARGFIRPMCVAYFTSDKYKLVMLAESILKRLTEISSLLQHFNTLCAVDDLMSLKENMELNEEKLSKSGEAANDRLLKDIQDILDIVKEYEGNELYDKQLFSLLNLMTKNIISEEVQNWISSPLFKSSSESHKRKLLHRSNSKTCMKDLYQICDKGVLLCLYHLYVTHKYLKRKYENIAISSGASLEESKKKSNNEYCLYFGACVQNTSRQKENYYQNDCILNSYRVASTFAFDEENYFSCVNTEFEKVVQSFINWETNSNCESHISSTDDISQSNEDVDSSEFHSDKASGFEQPCDSNPEPRSCTVQIHCAHIVPLHSIWDSSEYLIKQNPDVENAFSKILKLFNDSERLFFSVLTRLPIVIFSTPHQSQDAVNFILALSIFIPRSKRELLFVDLKRVEPLTAENCNKFIAIHFCLKDNDNVGDLVPLELMSNLCILNLKECALTAPTYSGRLLADINLRFTALPLEGIIFPAIVGFLSEVEFVIKWWHQITSSKFEASEISSFVLSKGYTRSDMQIIEKLYELWKS